MNPTRKMGDETWLGSPASAFGTSAVISDLHPADLGDDISVKAIWESRSDAAGSASCRFTAAFS